MALGCWNSIPTRCRGCWSMRCITPGSARRPGKEERRRSWARTCPSANWLVKSLAAAGQHHTQGCSGGRSAAGCILSRGRRAPSPANPARHRGRRGDARKHGEPGDGQQVHRHAARRVRTQVLLHDGHQRHSVRWRKPQRRKQSGTVSAHWCRPRMRKTYCRMMRLLQPCDGKAWTLPAGPWPNIGRRCASQARCSASGRRRRRFNLRFHRRSGPARNDVEAEDAKPGNIGDNQPCRSRYRASRSTSRTRYASGCSDHLDVIAGKYFDDALEASVTFSRARSFFTCDINVHAGPRPDATRRG